MVTVGLLIRLHARPGKEEDVETFLEGVMPIIRDEPATTALFGVRFGPAEYGIFNAFPDEAGRAAHVSGLAAAALFERVGRAVRLGAVRRARRHPGGQGRGARAAMTTRTATARTRAVLGGRGVRRGRPARWRERRRRPRRDRRARPAVERHAPVRDRGGGAARDRRRSTRTPLPRGRALTGSVLYGAFGFAGAFGCIHWALVRVPPADTQTILALVPLLTFLFAVGSGLERFRARAGRRVRRVRGDRRHLRRAAGGRHAAAAAPGRRRGAACMAAGTSS